MYVVEHPELILFFSTFPILGLLIKDNFSDKVILYILIAAAVLLLPALTGYSYIVSNGYAILIYISLACGYSFYLKNIIRKIINALTTTFFLFLICGFISFFGAMGGSITVIQKWKLNGYNIEYKQDQGFAGGALMTYRLSKYAIIPIFLKEVDSKVDNDTINRCQIKFDEEKLIFDKCKIELKSMNK